MILLLACAPALVDRAGYDWGLPDGVDPPPVPADNPMSVAKVELGRSLFYDVRFSEGEVRACGTCHEQIKGFTDGFPRAVGATGVLHTRNTLTLTNAGYREVLTWARTDLLSLEEQLLVPLLGTDPVEMGATEARVAEVIAADPAYQEAFPVAFPDDPGPYGVFRAAQAIAAFERTLISVDSPWDRQELGEAEVRGSDLFFGRLACDRCHGGPDFDGPVGHFNVGLYDVGGGAYPAGGEGLMSETGDPADMGRFRTPTLRNLAWTDPYWHDGTGASLEDVVDVLAAGGRNVTSGPNVGDGRRNPHKDPAITGFALSESERSDLIAFLLALSDPGFVERTDLGGP